MGNKSSAKYAAIRVSEETHERFRLYIAKRFVDLREELTANEALNALLDVGERDLQKERELRLGGGSVPVLGEEERSAAIKKQHNKLKANNE
jgi:hypothetical protein